MGNEIQFFLFYVLLAASITSCAAVPPTERLSKSQIDSLLMESGIDNAWDIDQMYTPNETAHWIVFVLEKPTPLQKTACIAQEITLWLLSDGKTIHARQDGKRIALQPCSGLKVDDFHTLNVYGETGLN